MSKTKSRIIAFLIGILICLALLELSLRIVGTTYTRLSESDKRQTSSGSVTILAIGDSVTFGIGAPRGFSYPAQLQKMLNKSHPDERYTVINRGRPGQNSAQILLLLEDWLQEFHPDIVTVLIGAQNQVNYFGYQDYLQRSQHPAETTLVRIHEALDRIRIYKFFRLLLIDLHRPARYLPTDQDQQEFFAGEGAAEVNLPTGLYASETETATSGEECSIGAAYREQGDFAKVLEVLLSEAGLHTLSANCYNMIGSIYREQGLSDEAILWFAKGIEQDPALYSNYEEIGGIYYEKEQPEEAIKWFKEGITLARPGSLHDQAYVTIGFAFEEIGATREAIAFFTKEKERRSGDAHLQALAGDYLLMFTENERKKEIHTWIQTDIERILALCRRYNTKVILQNYPAEPQINAIYRRIALLHNLPFVDHQLTFQKYIHNGVRSDDYFVPDGHPNTSGYHLMAANIFSTLSQLTTAR